MTRTSTVDTYFKNYKTLLKTEKISREFMDKNKWEDGEQNQGKYKFKLFWT